ncbi:MAG: hypothetical protein GY757_58365, partial [bacterium]|nr:hypothetical protein [bacterium]
MAKKIIVFLSILSWALVALAQDRTYRVTLMYEADDQGKVLTQQAYSGTVILRANGTYSVKLYYNDEGTYQYTRANASQPKDMILFYSKNKYQYFAYPQANGNAFALWLNKPRPGVNLWVNAQLATQPAVPPPAATSPSSPIEQILPTGPGLYQQGLIQNSRFAKVLMFSSTSAGSYYYYNDATGGFAHDGTGIIFHPAGNYYLKAEMGMVETEE